jgi:hypothetical protein
VFNELEIFNNKKKVKEVDDRKRVELCVLEFDWIFEGDYAINFIKKLATSQNDDLFANQTI